MQESLIALSELIHTLLPQSNLEAIALVEYAILAGVLVVIAIIDKRTLRIPNAYVLGIIGLWTAHLLIALAICILDPNQHSSLSALLAETANGIMAAFLTGGGLLLLSIAFGAATGKPSIGGGDIKLLFALGLFLGIERALANLLTACLIAVILAPILSRPANAQDQSVMHATMPFGPAICLATITTLTISEIASHLL